jgi:hypothetical protein
MVDDGLVIPYRHVWVQIVTDLDTVRVQTGVW